MLKLQNKIPSALTIGGKIVERVLMNNEVVWEKVQLDYFYIESLADGNTISVINVVNTDTGSHTPTLEYSTDKNTWNTITFDTSLGTHTTELPVKLNTGEKMYFRNDTRKFSNSSSKYISFSPSVSSNVGGDIRTLSNYLDVNNETKPKSNMFGNLFYNNKFIVDASNLRLPYTTLANGCYLSMFGGCTSLVNAPTLPATTLANYCYEHMFWGCKNLTTAPALPATALVIDCYRSMFEGCTSLTTAPELPTTSLASGCYEFMFQNCTSLTTAPELPATTLSSSCYRSMFEGCTSLTTAPALPATTLADYCYDSVFEGCKNLTTAPALPATSLAEYCYRSMFQNCTSLTTAPALPATTLTNYCYQSMFWGCKNLTTAPALPATTLTKFCYRSMFQNCTSLNNVTVYADDNSASNCTTDWLSGVASTGTFRNLGSATYPTGLSGIPSGWTEVKN